MIIPMLCFFFFFNDTATTEIYTNLNTLSLHDALLDLLLGHARAVHGLLHVTEPADSLRSEEHTSELQSHSESSYAVFCLKKKKTPDLRRPRGRDDRLPGSESPAHPPSLRTRRHSRCPFFFNDTATTEIYTNLNTLSLHDALPI